MAKNNVPNTPKAFMGAAECLLKACVSESANLKVWRSKYSFLDVHDGIETDMILVGMSDDDNNNIDPLQGIILIRVYLDGPDGPACMEFYDRENYIAHTTPFGGRHVPLDNLQSLAEKLSDL